MYVTRRLLLFLIFHSLNLCVVETGRAKRVVGGTEVGCGKYCLLFFQSYTLCKPPTGVKFQF